MNLLSHALSKVKYAFSTQPAPSLVPLASYFAMSPTTAPVINPDLVDMGGHRARHYKTAVSHRIETEASMRYSSGIYKQVKDVGLEYISKHSTDITASQIILLTHPFLLHLSDRDVLQPYIPPKEVSPKKDAQSDSKPPRPSFKTASHILKANTYLEDLFGLLHATKHVKDIQTIVLETPDHFAAGSSFLLKNKLIDDVFFTGYSGAQLLYSDQYDVLKGKTIFLGGLYRGNQVNEVRVRFQEKMSFVDVFSLSNLILDNPHKSSKMPLANSMTSQQFIQDYVL